MRAMISRPTLWLIRAIQRRFPSFRYGFVITLLAGLAPLFNAPGASFAVGFFLPDFIEALGTSRSAISFAWTVAVCGTALVGPGVGRAIDLLGPKAVMFVATLAFTGAAFYISNMTATYQIFIAFFLIRLGNNTVSAAGNNANNQWWIKARARSTSFVVALSSLSFAYPALLAAIREHIDWRDCWTLQGGVIFIVFMTISFLLLDRPELFGFRPDETLDQAGHGVPDIESTATYLDALPSPTHRAGTSNKNRNSTSSNDNRYTEQVEEVNWRWQEAFRTTWFWVVTIGLLFSYVHWSGFNFHYLQIIEETGLPPGSANRVFPVTAAVSVVCSLFAGQQFDRLHNKSLGIIVGILACALSLGSLLALHVWPLMSLLNVFAVCYGVFISTLSIGMQMIYAAVFGRTEIGTIQSVVQGANSIAVGIGPFAYGLTKELCGSFVPVLVLLQLLLLASAAVLYFNDHPVPCAHKETQA